MFQTYVASLMKSVGISKILWVTFNIEPSIINFFSYILVQITEGEILISQSKHEKISLSELRKISCVVFNDGFLFNGTILENITLYRKTTDLTKIRKILRIVELDSVIEKMSLGLNTTITSKTNRLSQGQKQRLLIARALYREPEYLFFDEATNSIDVKAEKEIINNIKYYLPQLTLILISHRLDTIINAREIFVMEAGTIQEVRNYKLLVKKRGVFNEIFK